MGMEKPPSFLSPATMLLPSLHYPALLAHQAQLVRDREKSAFSPISSLLNLSSSSSSSPSSTESPLTSPKVEREEVTGSGGDAAYPSPNPQPQSPSIAPPSTSLLPYQGLLPSLPQALLMRYYSSLSS